MPIDGAILILVISSLIVNLVLLIIVLRAVNQLNIPKKMKSSRI